MTVIARQRMRERARDFLELHRSIRCIDDERARDDLLQDLKGPTRPYIISFFNAHAANLAWTTPSTLEYLLRSDLLLRDGIGVQLSLKAFGYPRGLNMNGTDFIPQIARAYSGRRAALFGTCSPWLDGARQKLESEGVVVVVCLDGFSSIETYLDLAAKTQPELLILAMGMPKQEQVAVQLAEQLAHPALIVNGGAILDFLGGRVTRAPRVMQKTGTEWVYRLALEPRRLARRYVFGIPIFFSHVAMTRLVLRRAFKTTERIHETPV